MDSTVMRAAVEQAGYRVKTIIGHDAGIGVKLRASLEIDRVNKLAKIYMANIGDDSSFYHEIYHAYNVLVRRNPYLKPAMPWFENVERLNNDLDHLHIIPDQVNLFPVEIMYWDSNFADGIRECQFRDPDADGHEDNQYKRFKMAFYKIVAKNACLPITKSRILKAILRMDCEREVAEFESRYPACTNRSEEIDLCKKIFGFPLEGSYLIAQNL